MTNRLAVGRLAGVRLEVGVSWLLILPILAVALFSTIMSDSGPIHARAAVAAAGSVLLLGSVLAHEAGHVVAAVRRGIEVERVAVLVLGGFSEMDLAAAGPRHEQAVVAAGPAVSALVGVGFWLAARPAPATAGVEQTLVVLALVNVAVAVFNVLPAFPLDGGRLVRAWLILRGMEPRSAELRAARLGVVVGSAIAVGGVALSVLGQAGALLAVPAGVAVTALSATALRS